MKRFCNYLMLLLGLLLIQSCGRDENTYPGQSGDSADDVDNMGYMTLPASFNLSVSIAAENAFTSVGDKTAAGTKTATKTTTKAETALDNYIVEIIRQKSASTETIFHDTYAKFKEKIAAGGETGLKLYVGNYTISARSAETNQGAGFDTPYYESEPISFSIQKDQTTTISDIVCKLKNVKVTVALSADLMDMFQTEDVANGVSGVSCKVSLTPNTLTYNKAAMSGATVNDLAAGYFAPTLGEETINLELTGNYNTATGDATPVYTAVKMNKTLTNVKAGQWRKVTVSVQHVQDGTVTFTVTCQTWMEDEDIVVDVQTTKFAFAGEELIADDDSKISLWANNAVTEGSLKLTESMFSGETCTVPVGIQIKSANAITGYTVAWNSTNADFMTDYGLLYSNPIDLIAPTANESRYLNRDMPNVPYGDELKNQKDVTFSIAPYLYNLYKNYPGTHNLINTMTDVKGVQTISTITFVVPAPSTGGPAIVWADHDFGTRYTIDPKTGLSVVINITSETGITGFKVHISGDVLKDKDLTDLKLASDMDLITPATEDMKSGLSGLGFPVGDQVLNQKSINLDISKFMPMLLVMGRTGNQDFQLSVTDASGTSTKTIMVKIQ